jgi:hypothetical protein
MCALGIGTEEKPRAQRISGWEVPTKEGKHFGQDDAPSTGLIFFLKADFAQELVEEASSTFIVRWSIPPEAESLLQASPWRFTG